MSNLEHTTSWQQIQQGVREAERLIVNKNYNLVMVKARQTLECMVRCMAERACLVEGDLSDTIDQLYEGGWIDKQTKDNYHTIRILGNKAVHENDNTAYNADQAYQLLTQEVHAFSHDVNAPRGGRSQRPPVSRSSQERAFARGEERMAQSRAPRNQVSGSRTGSRHTGQGQRGQAGRSGSGQRGGNVHRRKRRRVSPLFYLWRLLIPVLVVIFLIVVIRMMRPAQDDTKNTVVSTESVTTSEAMTESASETESESAVETEPETEPEADVYVVAGNSVNVRTEPSTSSRILVQLAHGAEVNYVKRYNNDWTVINYDGQEAYVSSKYIEKKTPETESAPETEHGEETQAQSSQAQ